MGNEMHTLFEGCQLSKIDEESEKHVNSSQNPNSTKDLIFCMLNQSAISNKSFYHGNNESFFKDINN